MTDDEARGVPALWDWYDKIGRRLDEVRAARIDDPIPFDTTAATGYRGFPVNTNTAGGGGDVSAFGELWALCVARGGEMDVQTFTDLSGGRELRCEVRIPGIQRYGFRSQITANDARAARGGVSAVSQADVMARYADNGARDLLDAVRRELAQVDVAKATDTPVVGWPDGRNGALVDRLVGINAAAQEIRGAPPPMKRRPIGTEEIGKFAQVDYAALEASMIAAENSPSGLQARAARFREEDRARRAAEQQKKDAERAAERRRRDEELWAQEARERVERERERERARLDRERRRAEIERLEREAELLTRVPAAPVETPRRIIRLD